MSYQRKKYLKKIHLLKNQILPRFLFSTGTKSSENDRFYPIFVVCTGIKSSEKNGKKVEKKVFLSIYPGLKSEFLRTKTLFMHLRPRLKS